MYIRKTMHTIAPAKDDHLAADQVGGVVALLHGDVALGRPFRPREDARVGNVERPDVVEGRVAVPSAKDEDTMLVSVLGGPFYSSLRLLTGEYSARRYVRGAEEVAEVSLYAALTMYASLHLVRFSKKRIVLPADGRTGIKCVHFVRIRRPVPTPEDIQRPSDKGRRMCSQGRQLHSTCREGPPCVRLYVTIQSGMIPARTGGHGQQNVPVLKVATPGQQPCLSHPPIRYSKLPTIVAVCARNAFGGGYP